MAAIDLLLHSKKDSERLHQLVLAALLGRTHLLSRLVPLPGAARLDLAGLALEPDKTFDLGVPVMVGGERSGRVLVEVRIDATLDEDQLEKQLNPRLFHATDHLLYLLLGYSEITLQRGMLTQALGRIGRRDRAPDLAGRVSVRGASDLIPLLADPEVLPDGPDRHDARDLLSAYRDLLCELRRRVTRFASQPVAAWTEGDYYGLFARCRAERRAGMADAVIGRAAGTEAGVIACEWCRTPIAGGELSLQFEDDRLCVKLRPTQESQRKRVREQVDAALASLGISEAPEGARGRLVSSPRRLGSIMTVAHCDGLLEGVRDDLAPLAESLGGCEEVVRAAARALPARTQERATAPRSS